MSLNEMLDVNLYKWVTENTLYIICTINKFIDLFCVFQFQVFRSWTNSTNLKIIMFCRLHFYLYFSIIIKLNYMAFQMVHYYTTIIYTQRGWKFAFSNFLE